ncbi:hypothetical protein ACLOJK_034002 [Asimina triloba]
MLVSRTPSSILSCQNLCPIFVFNPHFKQTSSSQSLLVTAPHPFHNANLSFALPRAAPNDGSRGKLGHAEVEEEEEEDGFSSSGTFGGREVDEEEEDVEEEQEEEEEEEEEFSSYGRFRRREDDKDYDRDPEFAEILGSCFEDPQKAQARVEARIRKKRNKILHAKAGSSTPMKVSFNNGHSIDQYLVNPRSSFVGIKQLVFGGLEFENWKEGLSSEDAGFSVHKI